MVIGAIAQQSQLSRFFPTKIPRQVLLGANRPLLSHHQVDTGQIAGMLS